ncbi:hypothetical protein QEH59_07840 [Coraliomargarita sp. SDUM461004]|uniref:Alpha/beta hydrolase n=1 Tax=Thalassobacterium sedimentorum TaxID=3041258 RepID=A0ABU1AI15_9BACT|nr:hypothetical protein [Coraliomargarita sp. SDUM461004]MDQ8194332.1 hypothetical protein [Coraliomargarita sp. SDUM461004]
MHKIKRPLLLLFAVVISSIQIVAQDAEEGVTMTFSTLSWQGSIKELLYFNNGAPTPILIPNGAPGSEFTYKGPPNLSFHTQEIDEEGKPIYPTVASTTVANHQELLLIFFPTRASIDSALSYRILALPAAEADFTSNAFNFYNLTKKRLAIRVGEHKFQIAPGTSLIMPLATSNTQNVDVQMAANQQNNGWTMIYQSRWAPPKRRRAWVFIHGEGEGTPEIRKYYQVLTQTTHSQ